MSCTINGIAEAVVAEDKTKVEKAIREVRNMSVIERAELSNTPEVFLTNVVNIAKPRLGNKPIDVLDLRRDEQGNFLMKYKLRDGKEVITTDIGDVAEFTTGSQSFQLNKGNLETFYSSYDHIHMFDNCEELALDITNNPKKIMEVAQALIDADEYHNDELHNPALWDQLGRITNTLVEMVPNLNVHINNAAAGNYGKIEVDTNDIYIAKGVGGTKSLMEIYVHELYHAITHYAITSTSVETRGVTARMEKIRDNFLEHTTEADLMRASGNTLTEKQASDLLDYLTDPNKGLHEFVALGMSNKAVMNQLKTLDITGKKERTEQSLFYRLVDAVYALYNIINRVITKEPKGNDFSRMVFLVSRLNEAHKKPQEAKRLLGIRNLISIFDPFELKFSELLEAKRKKMEANAGRNTKKPGESDAKYLARLVARSFYDKAAAGIIGNTLSLATAHGFGPSTLKNVWNIFRPEGTIRTLVREMTAPDATQNAVARKVLGSGVIDQQREFRSVYTAQVIKEGFSRKLTAEEEVALTDVVLDTDLSCLQERYDLAALLGNNVEIDKVVKKLVAKLKTLTDEQSVNFYEVQTSLLANYMNNHEDNIALLKNAENIAKKLGTDEEVSNVSEELVTVIDDMATLKALRQVTKEKRNVIAKLLENEPTGVHNLLAFHRGQKQASEDALFSTPSGRMNIIKGYSAQITNQDISVTIAPLGQRKKLEAQGYKLVKTLTKHELDRNNTASGLFVNNQMVMQNFHRVGLRMTDKGGHRGTSITESYSLGGDAHPTLKAVNDIRRMKKRRAEVIALMHEGKYDPEAVPSDGLISPVFNKVGQVKDFTYGMNKEVKIELLEMERKATVIMGRTAASSYDKKATEEYNAEMMESIRLDAEENLRPNQLSVIGKNQKEYIKITKDSSNPEVRNVWRILPSDIKSKYPDGFTIRRDLMYSYLGYRELSIADLPGIKQFFDNNPNAYKAGVKYAVQFAEKLWQELIKISKIDILIRTPAVFIGNVVSNFMLMYISGHSFKDITKLKLQGVKELKMYVDGMTESIKLSAKAEAGIATKEEIRRLNVIQNNLSNSPVKDLVDEGFYTTILEELEHGGVTDSNSYFNRLAKKKLKNVPKIFSDGIDLLYITERTKLFKVIEKAMQASDFAARYAQYHLMLEKGIGKEEAVITVRDNFINYSTPDSRFVEWANQMGFIMFTKYFTRIQRVLHRYGARHPAKLLLSILAQDYLIGELDTIDDQSPLVKDMGNLFYNPWDNMLRVFTPTTGEAVNWMLNGGK